MILDSLALLTRFGCDDEMMKRPHRLTIEIEPAFAANTRYHFENGALRVDFRGRESRIATPTLQRWSGFWRLCEFLNLWTWHPDYNNECSRDGQFWQIDIAMETSKRVRSQGFNAYPSLEDEKRGSQTMDRLALLLHFIDISLLTASPDLRNDFTDYSRLE